MMNKLLAYVSYKGSGKMSDFFSVCRNLELEPWSSLRSLSELGHIEFSWLDPSGWSVAPAVLALLPSDEPIAILCGTRSLQLVEKLQRLGLQTQLLPQRHGPDIGRVTAKSRATMMEAATRANITCPPDAPSSTLARCLSPLKEYVFESSRECPHPSTFNPLWWNPATGQFSPASVLNHDGLWRYQERARNGRTRYVLKMGDRTFQVGDPDAVRMWLRPSGETLATYTTGAQNLVWRRVHTLPKLYARALALCSGQLPVWENGSSKYSNVPPALAMLVLGRLGLTTKEVLIT